jgi:Na+/H+ antiporter NhaC
VLVAVSTAIILAGIMYLIQRILSGKELIDLAVTGIKGLVPMAIIMMLAFAIGSVCKALGTGQYVAEVSKGFLSPGLVPAVVFLVSGFIAFSTGTSWGTFAIMISIAVPMAEALDANVLMAIGAALGGGVFGDHASPISDTTILSSMATSTDHIEHVRTQLPYAMTAGSICFLLYVIMGLTA